MLSEFWPPTILGRRRTRKSLSNFSIVNNRVLNEEIANIIRYRRENPRNAVDKDCIELAGQVEGCDDVSIEEFVDQIKTMLFAGHDTSASMLAWTYYFLSTHPECLVKMKVEHQRIFGNNPSPDAIAKMIADDPTILGKLHYTHAALKEAIRLKPVGDGVRAAPPKYIVCTRTGAEFDAGGTVMNIQHHGLHLKKDIWGEDADEFRPERFLTGQQIPVGYMPFSKRPRDCIGRNVAFIEVDIFQ